jgi:hypothetical protein
MLEHKDGSKYVGYWKEDKMNGKGYLEDKDGIKSNVLSNDGVQALA